MASELNHHVGYSRENECWFFRFYPYQTEQQAIEAIAEFTRPTPVAPVSPDADGRPSPMVKALKVVRETNDKGRQAVQAWADSKAPPTTGKCGELETVAHIHYRNDNSMKRFVTDILKHNPENSDFWINEEARNAHTIHPLVTRSQAEELLAAKDQLIQSLNIVVDNFKSRTNALKADNAALTARVKELRIDRAAWEAVATDIRKQAKALEAKLTAAEKALTEIASFTQTTDLLWWQERARAALGGKPS